MKILMKTENTLHIMTLGNSLLTYIMASQLWFYSFLENASYITQACVEMWYKSFTQIQSHIHQAGLYVSPLLFH